MTRAGATFAAKAARRARVFRLTKGFQGKAKNCYTIAVRAAERALVNAYRGRKLKKRDFRKMWIQRINTAAREHDMNYSRFVASLAEADVQLNRKMLAHLAVHEPLTFKALADFSKARAQETATGLKQLLH
eukprot:m.292916 g.292916  ORF g.292916 m.292916 type:complete len:131 (-) comp12694_c0_seq1:146-538(-)